MYETLSRIGDVVGMVGVILLLIAYFLLSCEKWNSKTIRYQLFNCIGAAFILVSLYFHFNLSAVVIETCWVIISFIGMFRIIVIDKQCKF